MLLYLSKSLIKDCKLVFLHTKILWKKYKHKTLSGLQVLFELLQKNILKKFD